MSDQYLVIPRIYAQSANALSAYWLVNGPPVTAAVAFAHAAGLCADFQEDILGVGLIHHHAELQTDGEMYRPALSQRRGASYIDKKDYVKNSLSLSLQPTATRHLILSVIVRLDEDAAVDINKLESFLRSGRFSGGQIIEHGKIRLCEGLDEAHKNTPSGFWVIDRSDLIRAAGVNPNEALLDLLSTNSHLLTEKVDAVISEFQDAVSSPKEKRLINDLQIDIKEGNPLLRRLSNALRTTQVESYLLASFKHIVVDHSWLSATTIGYTAVTKPAERKYARNNKPHIYAEPLVGLTQYVKTRLNPITHAMFWHDQWINENTYIISQ